MMMTNLDVLLSAVRRGFDCSPPTVPGQIRLEDSARESVEHSQKLLLSKQKARGCSPSLLFRAACCASARPVWCVLCRRCGRFRAEFLSEATLGLEFNEA